MDDASKSKNKEESIAWKKKDDVECSLALCASEKQNLWHMDSRCSKHMTGDPTKFLSLKRKQKGKVTCGDNISSRIIGKGTMVIRDKMKVENVILVEKLKPNPLSVSQTCDQGHICKFDSKKCEIKRKDSRKLVGTAVRTLSNMYILENEEKCYMS